MKNLTNKNGLVIWNEEEIAWRNFFTERISSYLKDNLLKENNAWKFYRIESSCLIPSEMVNESYSIDDYFSIGELSLRPETTALSYMFAEDLLTQGITPPICVWQAGKSFRNENDQVQKNIRLKEFYQLEFQCIFSDGTFNDYHKVMVDTAKDITEKLLKLPTRVVESDRLPSYSEKTLDVEVQTPHKWLEVCSVSLRKDFSKKFRDKKLLVVEVAFGLDRLILSK